MKNKFLNKKNLISSCALILCIAYAMLFTAFQTDASDESKVVEYKPNYTYTRSEYVDATGEKKAPMLEGYLFAGWYTEEDNDYKPISDPQEGEQYYAKFVPEEVLDIRAQVSAELFDDNTENDSSAAIRFITSLDNSLNYHHVGFNIKKGSTGIPEDADTTKFVYRTIYAVGATDGSGEPDEYVPEKVFHSESYYLKTWTITNIKDTAYNTDVTVVPYWITLDGTRVEGTKAIKTVNLGRSWVYIDATANETDGEKYGTYRHPYTDLVDAIDAIVLDEGGKIVIKANAKITWDRENPTWETRGKDFTITGQTGASETLDFSSKETFRMGDNVTFEKMTLKLPTKQLYADGHRFKIAENVVSDNSGVIIFGGGNNNNVTGDTSVTLLSGSYNRVYGGGLNGDVDGNTYVTIQNVDIYDKSSSNTRFVFGGGRNAKVTGNTHVTVGQGFNSKHDWKAHSYLSAIFGGGHGSSGKIATVEKNTYVVIKDDAKTNYVHGAGMSYSEVKGTSHVTFDGGYAMSIYGGGSSEQAVNGSTSIVMKSGTVEQIFGGNPSKNSMGMTGNTDVRILGGSILRRVYGGCYNEYASGWESTNEVNGYVSVTFGPDTYASLATSYSGGDVAYLASSRYDNTVNETGVFIVNDYNVNDNPNVSKVGHSTYFDSIKAYNYLVQSTEGGAVYSEGDSIRVIPDENKVATVRVNSPEENVENVRAYITSEGLCKLPTLDSSGKTDVFVVFTDAKPSDVNLNDYEAKVNGTHFDTFENAITEAKSLSAAGKTPVVALLKDVEIDSVINVEASDNLIVQSEGDIRYKITAPGSATSASQNVFTVSGKLTINNVDIVGGYRGIQVLAGGEMNSTDGMSISGVKQQGLHVTNGTVKMANLTVSGTGTQAVLFQTNASVEISNFKVNGDGSSAAVRIQTGANVTLTDGTINANKTYGIYMDGDSSKVTATDVKVNRANGNTATLVVVATASTFTLNEETEGKSGIIGNSTTAGRGVEVQGTFNLNGGTISSHNVTSGVTGVFVLNSYTKNGAGVYVADGGVFDMNGGTIQSNQAGTGAGVALPSGATFTMDGGKIISNIATANAGAIVLRSGASLTINEGAEISDNAAAATGNGGGIYVQGSSTFELGGCTIANNSAKSGQDIYLEGTITLSKALASYISIKPNSYSENKVIVTNGSDYSTSMQYLNVEENNGHWFVNDEGKLKKAPVALQSTGVGYANIANAIAAAEEEDTIIILQNQEITESISIAGKLTFTSATAVTITASDELNGNMFDVAKGSTLVINGVAEDTKITLAGGTETNYVLLNSGTILLSNVHITGGVRGIHNNQGTIGTEENPLKNVSIIGASEYGLYTYGGNVNVGDIVVRNSGADAIRIQREEANVIIQKAELYDSASYGLVVKNGTVTVKNTLIDNAGITETTKNRIGIAAHGGTLTLDNVTVQNFVGSSQKNANHGIDHQDGQLIVTANETVDGGNKGLYIYNVKGHGIYSTGGSMNISQITIDGNSQTRAGIQLTGNTSSENKVSNATITGCSVQIQLKNASLRIENTFVQETENKATNYKTDGTKQ